MSPHDKKYNAVIGGTHETFEILAQQFGGLGIVFAGLTQQLTKFKELGPPKVSNAMMTREEIEYAKFYNDWGIEDFENVAEEYENIENDEYFEIFPQERD